ncbi:MAG: OmpA family protein [Deltaproteobacteria bacterium]|nr:MAG: OmpA family protein [Deltaproteobacteria bacterium]
MRWWPLLLAMGCAPRHAYPGGGDLEDQLEREVVALQQKTRMLETALETCGEGETKMYAAIHQIFAGSEVIVDKHGRYTIITLPADYAFGSEMTLRSEARMAFDLLALVLKENPDVDVSITGHTETRMLNAAELERFGDLWGLGFFMASSLRNVLVEEFSIPARRFVVGSAGGGRPVSDNDTEHGQRANRRLVVTLDEPARAP